MHGMPDFTWLKCIMYYPHLQKKVLIDSIGSPVICGYGTSKALRQPAYTTSLLSSPIRFASPECFSVRGNTSSGRAASGDIYAFSMVILEVSILVCELWSAFNPELITTDPFRTSTLSPSTYWARCVHSCRPWWSAHPYPFGSCIGHQSYMAIFDFAVEPGPIIETRDGWNRNKLSSDVRAHKIL